MTLRRHALNLAAALSLAACTPSYDDQVKALEALAGKRHMGSSPDYWLVKSSSLEPNDRVALVFGFLNDFAFCMEIAELYMQRYPTDRYTCRPAN